MIVLPKTLLCGYKNTLLLMLALAFFCTTPASTALSDTLRHKTIVDIRVILLIFFLAIIGLFLWVVNKKKQQPLFLTTTRLSVMDKEVQKTCRYIEKNFADQTMTVDSICNDLVTGKAFLEALFEKELGLSVEKFIEHVRINRARILIEKDPSITADTAAFATGYSSPLEFTSTFKTLVATPFNEYCTLRAQKGTDHV